MTDRALVETGGRLHRWRAHTGRKYSRQRRSQGGRNRLRKMEGQARSRAPASGIHSPYSRAARLSRFRSRKTVASITHNIPKCDICTRAFQPCQGHSRLVSIVQSLNISPTITHLLREMKANPFFFFFEQSTLSYKYYRILDS